MLASGSELKPTDPESMLWEGLLSLQPTLGAPLERQPGGLTGAGGKGAVAHETHERVAGRRRHRVLPPHLNHRRRQRPLRTRRTGEARCTAQAGGYSSAFVVDIQIDSQGSIRLHGCTAKAVTSAECGTM